MAPVGIYPGDIAAFVPVVNSLGANQRPFWHHIQWYSNVSLNETTLIQNNRSTINYSRDGEYCAKCDSASRNAWDVHWNKGICLSGFDTVLLHGVKDDSLINLIAPIGSVPAVVPPKIEAPIIVEQVESPKAEPISEGFQEFAPDPEEEQRAIIAPLAGAEAVVVPPKTRKQAKPKRRSRMSVAARQAMGERMSARWAERRAAKAAKEGELATA
jgi:hypothetical protein